MVWQQLGFDINDFSELLVEINDFGSGINISEPV